jgi:thiosulfate/3-mercaptopyruvate sulfurtransferase
MIKKIAFCLFGLILSASASAAEPLLNAQATQTALTAPATVVIDIRDPKSYATGHIAGALNAPYGTWRGPESNPGELPSLEH